MSRLLPLPDLFARVPVLMTSLTVVLSAVMVFCDSRPVAAQQPGYPPFYSAGEPTGPYGPPAGGRMSGYPSEIIQHPSQQSAGYSIGALEPDYFSMNQPQPATNGDGGMGWQWQLNYQTGKTIGTEESLLNVGGMPYVFWNDTMFLGDLSLFRLNSGRWGGFAGAGVRQYLPGMDRTLGVIASYGLDGTYDTNFENITIGLESRGQHLDWLSNIYIPVGEKEQLVGLNFISGSQEFIGNNIQYDQTRIQGYNLSGFDMMFGTPLPWEFAKQHNMRAYAGFYNFNHSDIDSFWGWSTRLEANMLKYIDMNLNVSHDDTFKTRVTFNASWTFDPGRENGPRRSTWERMMLPPSRLYTVPKAEVATREEDLIAINPVTGLPYYVVHVNSNTGVNAPGAGTVDNPFNNIDNAINGGNAVPIDLYDIVFVHSGSTFDNAPTIVVPEGKRFLGEGDRAQHYITYNNFGPQLLPRANGSFTDNNFDARPLFTNLGTPGNPGVTFDTLANLGGATLSNNVTEFSGFVLGNPDGSDPTSGDSVNNINPNSPGTPGAGPQGNGIEFAVLGTERTVVSYVDIHGAQGDGMSFNNLTGNYNLNSIVINQSLNHEMDVNGGDPNIVVNSLIRGDTGARLDSLIINRDNGSANAPDGFGSLGDNHLLLVRNTTGGSVMWNDVVAHDLGGDGIMFSDSASNASIAVSTTLQNTRAQGIFISPGSSGNIVLSAARSEGNLAGTALRVIDPGHNAIQIGIPDGAGIPGSGITNANVNFIEPVSIEDLDQRYSGLFVADNAGDVLFFSSASLSIDYDHDEANIAGTASGIEFFQNSTGNLTFNGSITVQDSGGAAIRISNNTNNTADPNTQSRFRILGQNQVIRLTNSNQHQGTGGAALVIGNDTPAGSPGYFDPSDPANPYLLPGSPFESIVQIDSQVLIAGGQGMGIFSSGNTGNISFGSAVNIDSNINEVSLVYLENNSSNITFASLVIDYDGINADNGFANPQEPGALALANFHAAVDLRENTGMLRFHRVNIEGQTTGFFGINNSDIAISAGSIDTTNATALEIFTTDSRVAAGGELTNISINIDEGIEAFNANDHGVHLANVKGRANFIGGDLLSTSSPLFAAPRHHAGMYLDNSAVRDREVAGNFDLFTSSPFRVTMTDLNITQNVKGIRAVDIDALEVSSSSFIQNSYEAMDLENVLFTQIQSTNFTQNQIWNTFGGDGATILTEYTRTLNSEEQANGNPQFYDFVLGPKAADFTDFDDNNIPNRFVENSASYSVLMVNNAEDNHIGQLNTSFTGPQTGFVVNNNSFTKTATGGVNFQSFVFYHDNENSRINMSVAMNDMLVNSATGSTANTSRGAIGFSHNSSRNNSDDNIVFTAIDNRMDLRESGGSGEFGSVGYHFTTRGIGDARIYVNDTNNDALTEELFSENDMPFFFNPGTFAQTDYNPDMQVAGTGFYFDLGTDAEVDIQNIEMFILEDDNRTTTNDGTISVYQRGFIFENVSGDDVTINIAGNTILFHDPNGRIPQDQNVPKINPITGEINFIENDLRVVEFNVVTGEASLTSTSDNNVLYFDGATSSFLTNPVFLFEASSLNNITGQFQFNGIFVP